MHTMRVSEINFPSICRPKTQGISLWCPPWEHFMEIVIKANSKKTQSLAKNSCRQKCLDKSLAIMFPFTPLTAPKNENFKTMKKRLGDIILHKSTKNHDHMLHCSWDMACVGCNCYFPFWAVFSPFAPLNSPKNENFTRRCVTDAIVIFHFGLFFALLTP